MFTESEVAKTELDGLYNVIFSSLGDQVLEWNGRVLQGATFNEVYNIILDSKQEPQVELVVCRPIGWVSDQAERQKIFLRLFSSLRTS